MTREYERTPHVTDASPLPTDELRAMVKTHTFTPWGWSDPSEPGYVAPPKGVMRPCGYCASAEALHPFPYFPTAKEYETNVRIGAAILQLIDEIS